MKKGKHFFFIFVLLFLSCFINFPIGLANWSTGSSSEIKEKESTKYTANDSSPVAFSTTTNKFYSKAEKAIGETLSGGTCYIIPGTNPVITTDCTVASGATLSIPYALSISNSTVTSSTFELAYSGAHADAYTKSSTYCKNSLIIGDTSHNNVTLTNKGTIIIGGKISGGSGGQSINSNTAGDYGELCFYGNSSLISSGTINNYGYIRGNNSTGALNFKNGSKTKLVFSINEHRGGTIYSRMYSNLKGPVFNRWRFSGLLDINYNFEYGCEMLAYADLYASGGHNDTEIDFLGSSSNTHLVSLMPGSNIEGKFDSTTKINNIDTYGSLKINSLNLNVIVTVSTKSVPFPLTRYQHITLNSYKDGSRANISSAEQSFKLMPSSYLKVGSNVVLNIPNLAVYDNFTDVKVGSTPYQDDNKTNTATLIVDGNLNVSGSFGGLVQTSQSNGRLSFSSNEYKTYEPNKDNPLEYQELTWTANGDLNSEGNNQTLDVNHYVSENGYWKLLNTFLSISGSSAESGVGVGGSSTLTAELNSSDGISASSYNWRITSGNGTLSENSGSFTVLTVSANNSFINDNVVTVECEVLGSDSELYTEVFTYTGKKAEFKASLSLSKTSSGEKTAATVVATASYTVNPSSLSSMVVNVSYEFALVYTGEYLDNSKPPVVNGNKYTFSTLAKDTEEDKDENVDVGVLITATISNNEETVSYAGARFVIDDSGGGCLLPGTKITMADGTYKNVEDITPNDYLLAFDHEKGQLVSAPVFFIFEAYNVETTVTHLSFSNGKEIQIVTSHGFYDIDLRKYVKLTAENYIDYIGHSFYTTKLVDEEYVEGVAVLESGFNEVKVTDYFSPVTQYTFNSFTEDLLSVPDDHYNLINYWEFDENLMIDPIQKQIDIDTYGLCSYEEFSEYMPFEVFDNYHLQYLPIAFGKGYMTEEELYYLINKYVPLFVEYFKKYKNNL